MSFKDDFKKKNNRNKFTLEVNKVVKTIPKGEMWSYKKVAVLAGRPGAFRAVGNIMSRNTDPSIPCHRVIRSDGKLGGYNGLMGDKFAKLKSEGAI